MIKIYKIKMVVIINVRFKKISSVQLKILVNVYCTLTWISSLLIMYLEF